MAQSAFARRSRPRREAPPVEPLDAPEDVTATQVLADLARTLETFEGGQDVALEAIGTILGTLIRRRCESKAEAVGYLRAMADRLGIEL